MTETEWLTCEDPARMLRVVTGEESLDVPERDLVRLYSASDRKLRLFACACARDREVWWREVSMEREILPVIEAVEARADGLTRPPIPERVVANRNGLNDLVKLAAPDAAREWALYMSRAKKAASPAFLLREVVGNPYRPVTLPAEWGPPTSQGPDYIAVSYPVCPWLTWNDGAVPRLAERIYQGRAWEEMEILADALEETGCDNEEILMHLRGEDWYDVDPDYQPGWVVKRKLKNPVHCRGCWAIDLLTGRE